MELIAMSDRKRLVRALEFFRAHDRSERMDGMLACYFTWHLCHA
jgi:hypothetical protein